MVSREDVINAYRLVLGREPESEIVVQEHLSARKSIRELRAAFIDSTEFRSQWATTGTMLSALGRHWQFPPIDVEVRCSPEELKKISQRVEREWSKLGEEDPYWSVLTDPQFRSDVLDERARTEFYASGKAMIAGLDMFAKRTRVELSTQSAFELGCGLGRITGPMAERYGHVYAADISQPHLKLAGQRLENIGRKNVDLICLRNMDDLRHVSKVDLCLSFIVLQHNPPPVIAALLDKMCKMLRRNGVLFVQLPTYMEGYRFRAAEYLKMPLEVMEIHCLPQVEVLEILRANGLRLLEVQEDNMVGNLHWASHTFFAQKI